MTILLMEYLSCGQLSIVFFLGSKCKEKYCIITKNSGQITLKKMILFRNEKLFNLLNATNQHYFFTFFVWKK